MMSPHDDPHDCEDFPAASLTTILVSLTTLVSFTAGFGFGTAGSSEWTWAGRQKSPCFAAHVKYVTS